MANIEMTRNEVLSMLQELPETHWMTSRLIDALNSNEVKKVAPEESSHETFPTTLKVARNNTPCIYEFYGHKCDTLSDQSLCKEHREKKCSYRINGVEMCGESIDHGCPAEMQFVCEAPLCSKHMKCYKH